MHLIGKKILFTKEYLKDMTHDFYSWIPEIGFYLIGEAQYAEKWGTVYVSLLFHFYSNKKSCNSINYRILLSFAISSCGLGGIRTLVQTRN